MELLQKKPKGFTQDFTKQLPSAEELGLCPVFPVSDAEMQLLATLDAARTDGEFTHFWERFVAVRQLARAAGRELGINFATQYEQLAVDPTWVHGTLLEGGTDIVVEQMERIQAVQETARSLGSYALASHTD